MTRRPPDDLHDLQPTRVDLHRVLGPRRLVKSTLIPLSLFAPLHLARKGKPINRATFATRLPVHNPHVAG